jgi:putative ABC transport system permease protein
MLLFETVLQDLRYGARALRRNLRFTVVSVLALALGIGVNTAVFTAYKAIVARPLDARDPSTLVNVTLQLQSGAAQATISYPDYEAYRGQLRSYSGVIAIFIDQLRLSGADGLGGGPRSVEEGSLIGRLGLLRRTAKNTELASAFVVSENYFSVLISENYWQRRFAGDPGLLGKSIRLNGVAFTIAGITPHDFVGTSVAAPDFWLPISLEPLVHPGSQRLRDREDPCCRVFGRLAAGVSRQQARAETTLLASQLRALHSPESELSKDVSAVISPGSPLPGRMNASLRLTVVLIMFGAGMVLVIACANVASLQLARATTRQQELGMRLTLGASRSRLIRQLLTESTVVGLLAGAAALPLTWALMHVAAARAAEVLPVEFGTLVLRVTPDLEVLAYVLAASAVAGLLFGLAPALQSSRSAVSSTIRGAAAATPGRSRLRHALVATQVAVSLALMIAGALLTRSAARALGMSTGYDANRVIDLSFAFPEE